MAEDRMAALELLRKAAGDGDLDFLREGLTMLTPAGHGRRGERPDRGRPWLPEIAAGVDRTGLAGARVKACLRFAATRSTSSSPQRLRDRPIPSGVPAAHPECKAPRPGENGALVPRVGSGARNCWATCCGPRCFHRPLE